MSRAKLKLIRLLRNQGFKNTFWNVFGTVLYPFLLLLATPLFIEKLGTTEFGIWILVNGISHTMGILKMGLGEANIRYISKYSSEKNYSKVKDVISTTFGLAVTIVIFMIVLGSSISYTAIRLDWVDISKYSKDLIIFYLYLSFLLFAVKFLEIIVLSIFQGFGRYDTFSKFSISSKSVVLVVNIIGVFLGANLVFIFISSICLHLVFVLIEIFSVKRIYDFISFRPTLNRVNILQIFSFSFWTWMQSVLGIVSSQVDKFVVAYFSGVQILSYYSIGHMVMNQIHIVFASSTEWLFPLVSAKISAKKSVKKLLLNSQALLVTCGFIAIIGILIIQKPVFTWWLGTEVYEKSERFITLFIYCNLPWLLTILPFYFLNGSGNAKYNTYSGLLTHLVRVVSITSMFIWIGNEGLIWGGFISGLVSVPIMVSFMWRYVFFEKLESFGINSVICCTLLVLFFEVHHTLYKSVFMMLFILLFYLIYIRPADSLKNYFIKSV